jgi:hypothetical protein
VEEEASFFVVIIIIIKFIIARLAVLNVKISLVSSLSLSLSLGTENQLLIFASFDSLLVFYLIHNTSSRLALSAYMESEWCLFIACLRK